MINQIIFGGSVLIFVIVYTCCFIEWRKKREIKKDYFISFIVPCYNDGCTIKETIESIYQCYKNFELFVINDNSSDDSLEKISKLKEEYQFNLIVNKSNLGKSKSINQVFPMTKGELIFVLDADMILNKQAMNDIINRFSFDEAVKGVSCPFRAKNKGFLPLMQTIEYNMYSLVQYSHNLKSTLSLWGGCLVVKRDAFEEARLFSENAIIEDMDLAVKLNKLGYKVEQSFCFVYTACPNKFISWAKQKIRWSSGSMQCLMTYPKVYFKRPVYMLFFVFNWFSFIVSIYFISRFIFYSPGGINIFLLLKNTGWHLSNIFLNLKLVYGVQTIYWGLIKSSLLLFSIPYVFLMLNNKLKESYKFIYLIPFSFVYLPVFYMINVYGLFVGIKKYYNLKQGGRAW